MILPVLSSDNSRSSGPNWIHGTENNPILDLARETATKVHSWNESQMLVDPHGHVLPQDTATEYNNLFWGIIADAFKQSNEKTASIPAEESLLDFFGKRIDDLIPLNKEDRTIEKKREMMLRMAEMWGPFVGSPVSRQSLKFFWLEECIEGENLFVADTYSKILDRIAQPALRGAEIRYQRKVSRITSIEGEPTRQVKVETTDATTEEFDEVVMTAPLGWLKRNKDVFEPPLPARLSQAIDSVGYGCLDKASCSSLSALTALVNIDRSISPFNQHSGVHSATSG